jgi:DNA-binding GntR family transcriptional regulator
LTTGATCGIIDVTCNISSLRHEMKADLERIQKRPSLKDEAYQRIKTLILSDRLSGGDMLDIDWLASGLGISRTPLREALLMLEQEGLIETIPYKGTFVVDVSKKDVEEIYQVREALEPLAVRLATPVIPDEELKGMQALLASVGEEMERGDFERYFQSDTDFHALIVRHCGNKVLQQVLGTLADRIRLLQAFSRTRASHHDMKHSFQEHCLILDALMERDVAKIERLMAEHIENARKRTADLVRDRS